MKEYALYKGDDLLAMGTVEEIAKQTGTKVGTIKYYRPRLAERKPAVFWMAEHGTSFRSNFCLRPGRVKPPHHIISK